MAEAACAPPPQRADQLGMDQGCGFVARKRKELDAMLNGKPEQKETTVKLVESKL